MDWRGGKDEIWVLALSEQNDTRLLASVYLVRLFFYIPVYRLGYKTPAQRHAAKEKHYQWCYGDRFPTPGCPKVFYPSYIRATQLILNLLLFTFNNVYCCSSHSFISFSSFFFLKLRNVLKSGSHSTKKPSNTNPSILNTGFTENLLTITKRWHCRHFLIRDNKIFLLGFTL